ncbi:MAG: hypothetical protein ACI9IP_002723, partial [Arcticibacterium sp.]
RKVYLPQKLKRSICYRKVCLSIPQDLNQYLDIYNIRDNGE